MEAFIEDDALSHGAAIAFYVATASAPVLYIAAAIAGWVFGPEATSQALQREISHIIGPGGEGLVRAALRNTLSNRHGWWANAVGIAALLITASGIFGEMELALNKVWNVPSPPFTVWSIARTRLLSLALVIALGFLLLLSLLANAAIAGFGTRLEGALPFGGAIAWAMNLIVSYALIAVLFAAIYKVLPNVDLEWRDVILGALGTAVLFIVGEYPIALYLGSGSIGYRYGAAGGLFLLLLWIYYTTQIFLLGAEFTRAYASRRRGGAAPESASSS